ncbi:MAG: PAS domain S-box protein [Syntrophaceae bacterium]|nr:PAS domain S-box protein [Syntrophaceae bacterium]
MEHMVERRRTDRRKGDRRGRGPLRLEVFTGDFERRRTERRQYIRRQLERKKISEARRENEEKHRILLEEIEDVYYETDLDCNLIFVNNAMCKSLKYTREELIGQKYWQLVNDTTVKILHDAVDRSYSSNVPVTLLDTEVIRKDGTKLIYETSVSVIRDTENQPIGFRGISRDVTERRKLEAVLKRNQEELIRKNEEIDESRKNIQMALDKLEKAHEELKASQLKILQQEKMASIGQLAAGVAHELNNPMSFISSNLGTLNKYISRLSDFIHVQSEAMKSIKDNTVLNKVDKKREELKLEHTLKDARVLLKESIDGSDRVKKIVHELNSFSRMDEEEYKKANINECIESAITIVGNELKYKSTLEKKYGSLPLTMCYPRQMNQVFVNLLINAVNAIPDKGVITIRTRPEENFICVDISDTGVGIPHKNLARIFEPFFTTKEVGKGTGLGLSITYEIIQRHKGEITVKSEEGQGTTFAIKIPVV